MVVEHPERFGLAQLHQLRGRIRRATYKPHFILIKGERLGEVARKRLEVIAATHDGFKIAEEDLLLRGPGDFFGASQSGFPELKIANPLRDLAILKSARSFAYNIIKKDPHLEYPAQRPLREHIEGVINARECFT
jgi:ATP-dependent DNA helicase RecG